MKTTIYTLLTIAFCVMIQVKAKAQENESFIEKIKITKVYIGPQYGVTFYEKDKNKSEWGIFGGVEFNDHYVIGYQWYESEIQKYEFKGFDDLYLSYHGPLIRYNFMTEKIVPYLSFMMGFGTASPQPSDKENKPFILQPSAGIDFELHKWVSAGVNFAYRRANYGDLITSPNGQTFDMNKFSAFMIMGRVSINIFNK
jgi:outer membrane protein with beta-barrel domain